MFQMKLFTEYLTEFYCNQLHFTEVHLIEYLYFLCFI